MSVKQQFTEEEIYKDRDSQISAIEKTFEDAQKSVTRLYAAARLSTLLLCWSCFDSLKLSADRGKTAIRKCEVCQR